VPIVSSGSDGIWALEQVPSHQLIVEVTGFQNPSSGLAGGYLICGKKPIFATMSRLSCVWWDTRTAKRSMSTRAKATKNGKIGEVSFRYSAGQPLQVCGLAHESQKWKELCT
jgi:hypothetical protein